MERSALSQEMELRFFLASWELQAQGWKFPIIPDALCCLRCAHGPRTVCFEYDRGEEPPEFVARTKFQVYERGSCGLSISQVIVVVDTSKRLEQLERYAGRQGNRALFLFLLRNDLRSGGNLVKLCRETVV
jgi:hypothetical protein